METGVGNELSEADILEDISPEPAQPVPQQPPGKLRKSAFRFFSSRKSICVLPSFFGGLGKGQGKSSSKTGVTKSRTHDGVSRGCWDDSVRGGGDVAAGDFEFRTSRDLGGAGGDSQKGADSSKSQFLPWQRRGLRGLFSSIRRHRRSKNVEMEKITSLEMLPSACNAPVAQPVTVGHHVSRSNSSDRLGFHGALEPVVPDSANGRERVASTAAECTKADALVPGRWRGAEGTPEKAEEGEEKRSDGEQACAEPPQCVPATSRQPLSAESELVRLTEENPDVAEADPPAASSSSDHASLVFGDVSSLKSFDSLTGCGDIIADQDDDSVAESSVSGTERGSRNAGKRSSCFVTYQGGGEEMATPDEVEGDYLQSLWESESSNEVCYIPTQQTSSDSLPITPDQPTSLLNTITITTSSSSGGTTLSCSSNANSSPLGVLETVLSPADITTPQSDRQESAPNSDEGYYDSTTPGADEEARERARPERLPRDSYSGDALYELFEPDERLLSPAIPDDAFLGVQVAGSAEGKAAGSPVYSLATGAMETGAMETEEDRLSRIQQALLCCELQSLRKTAKEASSAFNRNPYCPDTEVPLVGKKHPDKPLSPRGTRMAPVHLEDANPLCDTGLGAQTHDNPPYSQIPSPMVDESAGPYLQHGQHQHSLPSTHDPHHGPSLPGCSSQSASQEELAVCFSQALVDFTNRSHRVFCNSTESLDGSESGSPFGQNLRGLPAMVTFDVVDMENEGEFEQQTELAEGEEELASPFGEPFGEPFAEAFEDESCYLRKDAFAECDERMFDAYEQSLLLGNAWGITSLPRHLSSGRACQPAPAPLALNRRSRSLDTDSLELRMSEAGGEVQFEPVTAGSLHRRRNGHHAAANTRPCLSQPVPRDGWRHGHQEHMPVPNSSPLCQKQPSMCGPAVVDACPASKKAPQTAIRPSNLPLQPGSSYRGRDPTQSAALGAAAGGNSSSFLGGGQASGQGADMDVFYHCGFTDGSEAAVQGKARPIGVTQGVPHLCSGAGAGPNPWARSDKERDVRGKGVKGVEVVYGSNQTKPTT